MSSMQPDLVLSSRTRVKIAHLVSIRPRTLSELADLTGISVQAVLKHLAKLEGQGLVQEAKVRTGRMSVRKVYAPKGYLLGDYSTPGLSVVRFTDRSSSGARPRPNGRADLEGMAEDMMFMRRRVKEEARRLGRMIDDLAVEQARLAEALESMGLDDDERLILEALFTEESVEQGRKLISKHYGLKDGTMSIDRALSKATKNARKQEAGDGH